jgi:hypothetical protein
MLLHNVRGNWEGNGSLNNFRVKDWWLLNIASDGSGFRCVDGVAESTIPAAQDQAVNII